MCPCTKPACAYNVETNVLETMIKTMTARSRWDATMTTISIGALPLRAIGATSAPVIIKMEPREATWYMMRTRRAFVRPESAPEAGALEPDEEEELVLWPRARRPPARSARFKLSRSNCTQAYARATNNQ